MIFDDYIELKLVINKKMEPTQQPKQRKLQAAKRNKYEAEIEATYRINKDYASSKQTAAGSEYDKNVSGIYKNRASTSTYK